MVKKNKKANQEQNVKVASQSEVEKPADPTVQEMIEPKDVKIPQDDNTRRIIQKASFIFNEKEALCKSIQFIMGQKDSLSEKYSSLCEEFNAMVRKVQFAGNDFKSLCTDIDNAKDEAQKKYKKEVDTIKNKLEEIHRADKIYNNKLIEIEKRERVCESVENNLNQKDQLVNEKIETARVDSDRSLRDSVNNINTANELIRVLEEEKTEFEEYKATIEPDLQRTSSLRNENDRLIKKINKDSEILQDKIKQFDHYKQEIDRANESSKKSLKDMELAYINKASEFKAKEQALDDQELSIRAQKAEINRLVDRYKLKEQIKNG